MTPDRMFDALTQYPFPGMSGLCQSGDIRGGDVGFRLDGAFWRYAGAAWLVGDRTIPVEWPKFGNLDDGDRAHVEIRRVLAVIGKTAPSTAPTPSKTTIDDLRDALERIGEIVGADPWALAEIEAGVQRLATDAALYQLNRDFITEAGDARGRLAAYYGLDGAGLGAIVDRLTSDDRPKIADLQRRLDEMARERDAAKGKIKRLLRQRDAAHDVLDEAAVGLEPEGSPRWTLARRCRAAVEPVWGYLDALQAFDEIGALIGVEGKTGDPDYLDAVITRVKASREDSADLERLVGYHQAPVAYNGRPLTLAERASFVIRRLWQARANAAAESAALRRELADITDALSDLPETAEREHIGDREDYLALNPAERIRLRR